MNNKSNAGSIFYLEKRKRWVWVGTYNNEQGEKKKKGSLYNEIAHLKN